MLSNLIFGVGIIVGGLLYFINSLFGGTSSVSSSSPFECGIGCMESGRSTFSVFFFYFTVLFILFDVELCCLIPILRHSWGGFTFSFFLILLILGSTIVEIQDGVLKWSVVE